MTSIDQIVPRWARWQPAVPCLVVLLLLLAQPALARNLRQVAELAHHTRVLIDPDSVTQRKDGGRTLHEGVISIDNSRNPVAAGQALASDSKIEADCVESTLRIDWTRVYDRDGKLIRFERPGSLHEFEAPRSDAETAALEALCRR